MKFIFYFNAAPPFVPTVKPEGLTGGEIAGIVIGAFAGVFTIGVAIGFIIGFIVYRKKRKVPQSGIYYFNTCTIKLRRALYYTSFRNRWWK